MSDVLTLDIFNKAIEAIENDALQTYPTYSWKFEDDKVMVYWSDGIWRDYSFMYSADELRLYKKEADA